jgi:hypothetical protein
MTLVNLLGINYVRLIDNSGNVVSSVMLPTSGGDCCCDCTFNLIPTQDGAIASTNCDITWTGPEANAIWEARPATGDEEDWVELDGGYHNGVYDNGAAGLYIRVRYTIDSCERFSNIVTPLVCPCNVQIAKASNTLMYREDEGCPHVDFSTSEWQIRTNRNVWETLLTGDGEFDFGDYTEGDDYTTITVGVNEYIGIRLQYTESGCTRYSNIEYVDTTIFP